MWDVDSRKPGSPYGTVFFHVSELPSGLETEELPSREWVFEFDLAKATRASQTNGEQNEFQAVKIKLI